MKFTCFARIATSSLLGCCLLASVSYGNPFPNQTRKLQPYGSGLYGDCDGDDCEQSGPQGPSQVGLSQGTNGDCDGDCDGNGPYGQNGDCEGGDCDGNGPFGPHDDCDGDCANKSTRGPCGGGAQEETNDSKRGGGRWNIFQFRFWRRNDKNNDDRRRAQTELEGCDGEGPKGPFGNGLGQGQGQGGGRGRGSRGDCYSDGNCDGNGPNGPNNGCEGDDCDGNGPYGPIGDGNGPYGSRGNCDEDDCDGNGPFGSQGKEGNGGSGMGCGSGYRGGKGNGNTRKFLRG